MLNYEYLSDGLVKKMESDRKNNTLPDLAFPDCRVIRRYDTPKDKANLLRTAFIRDIDKIIHCPYYNRYADKTQVFSFLKNDDITRRGLHVQLVSRIARTIGKALNLNLDLIEAIALGHDIGHTPFGHAGERFLDEIFYKKTGRHFCHNIHSVRVLDKIYPFNISLQTLNGIASHDGEMELCEYRPIALESFETFDSQLENCYLDKSNTKKLVPATLEGCVVRISDIIAYLGKDRQDAERMQIIENGNFENCAIGTYNAEIINNLIVNIVENSYGKDYVMLDEHHFNALKKAKEDNYKLIYKNKNVEEQLNSAVKPIMEAMYERLLEDLINKRTESPIFAHHIDYVNRAHYKRQAPYEDTEPNQLVVDYIASMTDDYFLDLYTHLFPDRKNPIKYIGYFD